ncbi:g2113 [Coccomyxa elongata]
MSKPALARLSLGALSRSSLAPASQNEGRSMAEAFDEQRQQRTQQEGQAAVPQSSPPVSSYRKTLHLHIGADLHIPVRDNKFSHPSREEEQQRAAQSSDPFEGLPLRAWAEKLGERVMPAYELIKEEQAAAKKAAKAMGKQVQEVFVPKIPHVLPFTRWAAQNKTFQSTFIAEEPKERKKARLSWYHPDDTMVPRDWFRGGLLKDLAYYRPFSADS